MAARQIHGKGQLATKDSVKLTMVGTSDDGNRDYYRNSDTGIECTHAIRAALGRDGYIAWLRGTQMKYLWRGDGKDQAHPAEYAVKVGWYANELARVLADPTA